MELLSQNIILLLAVCALLGLIIGSFLNVVIYRLPKMLENHWTLEARFTLATSDDEMERIDEEAQQQPAFNLMVPRSACPHCAHQIRWYENIPVISWLALRGKCSGCKKPISIRYPLVEIATALLAVVCALHFGAGWYLVATILFSWVLLTLALIDYDTTLLPDKLTLPLLWAGILLSAFGISPVPLIDAVMGAVAGYLILWGVFWLFKLLTGKEGMGYGDFKLLGALGAWLGWQFLPIVILLSSVVGLVVGGTLIATKAINRNQGIPFGPYLAAAGWISLIWGSTIMGWWLGPL